MFFKINLQFGTSDYIWKTKLSSLNSVYLDFSSLEMQRRLILTKAYYKLFYSVWKKTSHKLLKVAAAQNSFPTVYIIDTTGFDECFLFHVITGRHNFYTNLSLPRGLVQPPCCCVFLKQLFWKKSKYYIRYHHKNITMLLLPKVQNKASAT